MKLQDDGCETAARQVEEVEASLEVLRVFVFVALVNGVVPDFPAWRVNAEDAMDSAWTTVHR